MALLVKILKIAREDRRFTIEVLSVAVLYTPLSPPRVEDWFRNPARPMPRVTAMTQALLGTITKRPPNHLIEGFEL